MDRTVLPGRPHDGARTPRIERLGWLLSAAVSIFGFWLFCNHMRQGALTADWPWLFRAGQAIWASGIPTHDTMSWTFPDRAWVLYQWLFEATAAPIYDLFGLSASVIGVCVLGFVMYMLWPAWYLARRGVHPAITFAVGGLVLIPVSVNLGLRPMLVTNLALIAQIMIVQRLREERLALGWALIAVAGVYVLWANSHLGFTLGLTSLVLYTLADLIQQPVRCSRARTVGRYLALVATAVIATGLNPYGWTLYRYIIALSLETAMNAHIHELQAPSLSNPYMALGLALVVIYGLLVAACRRRPGWAGVLHVGLFVVGTADSLRMVVWAGLFLVLAAPPLIQQIGERWRTDSTPAPAQAAFMGLATSSLLVALTVAVFASAATAGPPRLADCGDQQAGIEYLDRHLPPDARWFSSERTGSCTHAYAPARRVFIDTRFDMFPEAFVLAWFRAYQYRENWQALFARWGIQAALLADNAPLTDVLEKDGRFTRTRAGPNMWLFRTQAFSPAGSGTPATAH